MTDLSPRELEVLRALAAGKRNTAIAKELGIEPRTISQFKARAAKKLGLDHPTDVALVNAAREGGLLDFKQTTTFNVLAKAPPAEEPTSDLPESTREIAEEYPGKFGLAEWTRAEPNIKARIADGIGAERLRIAAMKYRRQHAALTRQEIDRLIEGGMDPDTARRRVKPVPIASPEKFFDAEGSWRSSFPLPAFIETPPEPVPGEGM